MFVSHLYVFGEMSVCLFGSFFDWVVYFSGIELHELRKKNDMYSPLSFKSLPKQLSVLR